MPLSVLVLLKLPDDARAWQTNYLSGLFVSRLSTGQLKLSGNIWQSPLAAANASVAKDRFERFMVCSLNRDQVQDDPEADL